MIRESVGVVGLGMMGGRVAGYLASQSVTTYGYDASPDVQPRPGVERCGTIDELAANASVVLLSLPDADAVLDCVRSIVAAPQRATEVVIDLSTIGVVGAQTASKELAGVGIGYVDSPVSGSITGAESGGLILMVGGPEETVERVRPVLECIGKHISHVGHGPGMGQIMKLINNAISGTTLAVASEALAVGCELGLDLPQMLDVINASTGRSMTTEQKFPDQILSGAYAHGGPGYHFQKDIGLFLHAAREVDLPHSVAEAASDLWDEFATEWPAADQTEIFPYLRGEQRISKAPDRDT